MRPDKLDRTQNTSGLISRAIRAFSSAWKGTWKRPMSLDEHSLDPFTVARMTDHNVKGSDQKATDEVEVTDDNIQAVETRSRTNGVLQGESRVDEPMRERDFDQKKSA